MNDKVSYRIGDINDVAQIFNIENESISDGRSETIIRNQFLEIPTENHEQITIVAENDGIIGYVSVSRIIDELDIDTIAVKSEYRGRHIGQSLMEVLVDTAKESGCSKIMLEVRENNIPARKLYEKCGFSQVGVREGYYTDNNENAILMDKKI